MAVKVEHFLALTRSAPTFAAPGYSQSIATLLWRLGRRKKVAAPRPIATPTVGFNLQLWKTPVYSISVFRMFAHRLTT